MDFLEDLDRHTQSTVLRFPEDRRTFFEERVLFWSQNIISLLNAIKSGDVPEEKAIITSSEYLALLNVEGSTDSLTQTWNRKGFEEIGNTLLSHAYRTGEPLTAAILDIDHFKNVNTEFGHFIGDRVLEKLVEIAKKRIRKQDIIGRWGGEEFAIVLPNTTNDGATIVMEELRKTF